MVRSLENEAIVTIRTGCVVQVKIDMDHSRFIFTCETNGSLLPEEVVESALKVLKDKLVDLKNNLFEIKAEEENPQDMGAQHMAY